MLFHLKNLTAAICAAFCFALLSAPLGAADSEFSFQVKNTTKQTITKLLASEDGKQYGNFDIGPGIKPGQTVTLVWDKSTDDEACEQWFKAVFDDGSEAKAVKFDFCESDLALEF